MNNSSVSNNLNNNGNNPPDQRGIHKYRFKWRKLKETLSMDLDSIIFHYKNGEIKYEFEGKSPDSKEIQRIEILNQNTIEKLNSLQDSFKVIGARKRNIIIAEVDPVFLDVESSNPRILVYTTLPEWREYIKKNRSAKK